MPHIARVGSLRPMVDADHGYGNALNVTRTVEEFDAAWGSALTVELSSSPASLPSESASSVF
jgi:oxaloacetate decarboxylase